MSVTLADDTVVQINATLVDGQVTREVTPLKVAVKSFKYDIGGTRGTFAGAVGQSVTDDDTSYVYLDNEGTLQINTTGFPTLTHIPLARVTAANGEIVSIINERVLLASSSSSEGTCIITLPVDGDVRGGDTAASSNNNWAAVKYEYTGTGEARNRIVRRTPRNYIDGDVIVRIVASLASSVASSKKSKWELEYKFASVGESLGTMASVTANPDHNGQSYDELFSIDLTIPEANVDMTKDYMALQINRDNDHADDDLDQDIYVHNVEIRYNGHLVAGQAGQ